MHTNRLTLWDFDDTLANSADAVTELAEQNPAVPAWMWWHNPALSTLAAERTTPIVERWLELAATPGDHAILTGRNGEAVEAWLRAHADHPVIGAAVRKIRGVISTSHNGDHKVVSISTAAKKAIIIARLAPRYADITLVDDTVENLEAAVEAVPTVRAIAA